MYIMKYIHMPLDHVLTMAHMSVANSPFKVVPVMFVGLCESHLGIDVSIIYKLLVEEARYKPAVLASAVGGYESDYMPLYFQSGLFILSFCRLIITFPFFVYAFG